MTRFTQNGTPFLDNRWRCCYNVSIIANGEVIWHEKTKGTEKMIPM